MSLLDMVEHRPWPLPAGPWFMIQNWYDLLFSHWPVDSEILRPMIPAELTLDTFDGQSWLSITPFHMDLRVRAMAPLPYFSRFPELNCRTYVHLEGKPGVFFFSLDAASRAAVWGARSFYHLPYFHSRMRVEKRADFISYSSLRGDARWKGIYGPVAPEHRAIPGTLEHWLTERYCLYAAEAREFIERKSTTSPGRCMMPTRKLKRIQLHKPLESNCRKRLRCCNSLLN